MLLHSTQILWNWMIVLTLLYHQKTNCKYSSLHLNTYTYLFLLYRFAFDGLPGLIVYILISEATYIKRLNSNGVQKMVRNILALQQNLSNFVPLTQCLMMERAREYYQLYNLGSEVKRILVEYYLC